MPSFLVDIANFGATVLYHHSFGSMRPIDSLDENTVPMLFIHGMSDTYVPSEMVHELYLAKPRDKEIWTKPGVIHARMYHDYPEEYTEEVRRFLMR